MTRRATRPFVPTHDPAYFDLQRQVNLLETMPVQPVRAPRYKILEETVVQTLVSNQQKLIFLCGK
jgi:hypothetical protein